MPQKLNRFISLAVLLSLLGNLVLATDVLAMGQQQTTEPLAALWTYGETYTTSSYEMLHNGVNLGNILTYLNGVPYLKASETSLATAQDLALTTANEAARSLGAAGGFSREAEQVLPDLFSLATPAPDEVFWENDFPAELEAGLGEWSLNQSQIDALESEVALKSDVRQEMTTNGLPGSTEQYLQSLGLTITETQAIETALGQKGVFKSGLALQLDRFKASQYEFATVRTQALIIYAQLLTRQIAVRHANGVEAQTPTSEDLETIADDQLRLLIHVGHLNAQWGSNPDLEQGEGDWWFIERYAGSAANRIGKLLIETQNPGLLVDFFVLKQMETTAITALAGDAGYAREELTRLAELLTVAIGGDEGQALIAPLLDSQPDMLAQVWPTWLNEYWQAPLEPEAQAYARQRIVGLAYPLPQGSGGVIPETNETNNRKEIIFNASPGLEYAPLAADIILQMQDLLGSLSANPVFNFLWGVLGGETDYPIAIVINALLSMIPVVGLAFDVIGLFDPDNLTKFLSLVGVVTSLGEVTIIIPVVGQVSGPGSFVGDKAIAVTKASYKILKKLGGPLVKILSKLPFDKAAKFGTDLLTLLVERGIKAFGKVNDIWTDAIRLLDELGQLVNRLWEALSGLAAKLGAEEVLKYGGSEGGMLLGRILSLSDEAASYTDEVLEAIVRLGDELAEAGIELSDDGMIGLGKLTNDIGEANTRRFIMALPCASGVTQTTYSRPAGLASPLMDPDLCKDQALKFFKGLTADDPARTGFSRLVGTVPVDNAVKMFEDKYDDAARIKILQTLSNNWEEFQGIPRRVKIDEVLNLFANFEAADVSKMIRNTDGGTGKIDVFADLLNSGKYTKEVLTHLRDAFLVPNTRTYEGLTFKFYSDLKLGTDDESIAFLAQVAEVQNAIWDKFKNQIKHADRGFEAAEWNCGLCGYYAYGIKDSQMINGRVDSYFPPDKNICIDRIIVGGWHYFFVDTNNRVWDPATNTWGQAKIRYDGEVIGRLKFADPDPEFSQVICRE